MGENLTGLGVSTPGLPVAKATDAGYSEEADSLWAPEVDG